MELEEGVHVIHRKHHWMGVVKKVTPKSALVDWGHNFCSYVPLRNLLLTVEGLPPAGTAIQANRFFPDGELGYIVQNIGAKFAEVELLTPYLSHGPKKKIRLPIGVVAKHWALQNAREIGEFNHDAARAD